MPSKAQLSLPIEEVYKMQASIATTVPQFSIPKHYDRMVELDRDVHDDARFAATEVDLALRLMERAVPERVLLPCCGTGRHISRLLERGVRRVVGVDLSPECLAKARQSFAKDRRVTLIEADLAAWRTQEEFDALILLGNSFGDQIDLRELRRVTASMLRPLTSGGAIVMDYIGEGYLSRLGRPITWEATFQNQRAQDRRTPRYDPERRIMTIDVEVTRVTDGAQLWKGAYQKRVLSIAEVRTHFAAFGVQPIEPCGQAAQLNQYYLDHSGELGMLARSTWWVGTKR